MTVIYLDRRSDAVHVPRASLSAAAENALAANKSAMDAIERAERHIWSGNRGAAIHALGRVGYEIGERTTALMQLTHMAESAAICPDGFAQPSHGKAS